MQMSNIHVKFTVHKQGKHWHTDGFKYTKYLSLCWKITLCCIDNGVKFHQDSRLIHTSPEGISLGGNTALAGTILCHGNQTWLRHIEIITSKPPLLQLGVYTYIYNMIILFLRKSNVCICECNHLYVNFYTIPISIEIDICNFFTHRETVGKIQPIGC